MTLHMHCAECHFLDIILRENGKTWKCPNCEFEKAKPIKQCECKNCCEEKKSYPDNHFSSFEEMIVYGTELGVAIDAIPSQECKEYHQNSFIEFGTATGISFLTSCGVKKLEPGKSYDENLDERLG